MVERSTGRRIGTQAFQLGLQYDTSVKTKAKSEYGTFMNALRKVLRVSKSDLNQMLAAEKIANQGKPKRGPKPKHSSDRASRDAQADDKD